MNSVSQESRYANLLTGYEAFSRPQREAVLILWIDRAFNYPLFDSSLNTPDRIIGEEQALFLNTLDAVFETWRLICRRIDISIAPQIERLRLQVEDGYSGKNYHYLFGILEDLVLNSAGHISAILGTEFVDNIRCFLNGMARASFASVGESISPSQHIGVNQEAVDDVPLAQQLSFSNPGTDCLARWLVEDAWIVEDPSRLRMLAGSRGRALAVEQSRAYSEVCRWMAELSPRSDGDPGTWWDEIIPKVAQQPDLVDWILGWPSRPIYPPSTCGDDQP